MFNTIVGVGAVGAGARAGAASRYGSGSGSDQKMRLLVAPAPAPQHCIQHDKSISELYLPWYTTEGKKQEVVDIVGIPPATPNLT
jgi:hypothetical protein